MSLGLRRAFCDAGIGKTPHSLPAVRFAMVCKRFPFRGVKLTVRGMALIV